MPQPPRLSKEQADLYRQAAQTRAPFANISTYAHVQPVDGGAFVEALIFIDSKTLGAVRRKTKMLTRSKK